MRGEGASWTDGQVNVLSTQTVKDFYDYDITGSTDNMRRTQNSGLMR